MKGEVAQVNEESKGVSGQEHDGDGGIFKMILYASIAFMLFQLQNASLLHLIKFKIVQINLI